MTNTTKAKNPKAKPLYKGTENLPVYNQKEFTRNIKNVINADNTIRSRVQTLILMGINQYLNNDSNSNELSYLVDSIKGCTTISTEKVKVYIHAVLGLILKNIKTKDGKQMLVFKKPNDAKVNLDILTVTWDKYSSKGDVTPDVDLVAQFKSFLTRCETAFDSGTAKCTKEELVKAYPTLKDLV